MSGDFKLEKVSGGYDIIIDGEVYGIIESHENTLKDIEIDEKKRGEGYGKKAVEKWVDIKREEGYYIVSTTTVISTPMENILESLGFERYSDTRKYRKKIKK